MQFHAYPAYYPAMPKQRLTPKKALHWMTNNLPKFALVYAEGVTAMVTLHTDERLIGAKLNVTGNYLEVAEFINEHLRDYSLRDWQSADVMFLNLIYDYTPISTDDVQEGFDILFTHNERVRMGRVAFIGDPNGDSGFGNDDIEIQMARNMLITSLKEIHDVHRLTRKGV